MKPYFCVTVWIEFGDYLNQVIKLDFIPLSSQSSFTSRTHESRHQTETEIEFQQDENGLCYINKIQPSKKSQPVPDSP